MSEVTLSVTPRQRLVIRFALNFLKSNVNDEEVENMLIDRIGANERRATDKEIELVLDRMEDGGIEQTNKFATLAWMPGDITCITELTEDQAADWLVRNEKHIRDQLCEHGNNHVIPTLLAMDGVKVVDQDNEENDE